MTSLCLLWEHVWCVTYKNEVNLKISASPKHSTQHRWWFSLSCIDESALSVILPNSIYFLSPWAAGVGLYTTNRENYRIEYLESQVRSNYPPLTLWWIKVRGPIIWSVSWGWSQMFWWRWKCLLYVQESWSSNEKYICIW